MRNRIYVYRVTCGKKGALTEALEASGDNFIAVQGGTSPRELAKAVTEQVAEYRKSSADVDDVWLSFLPPGDIIDTGEECPTIRRVSALTSSEQEDFTEEYTKSRESQKQG